MFSSVAMDGEDANGLKLEKIGSFNATQGLAPSHQGEENSYSEIVIYAGQPGFHRLGDYQ